MKPLPMTEIKTIQDVVNFFIHLMQVERLNFHPDDPMTDYVGMGTDTPTYTPEEAKERTRLLDECFAICQAENKDIYALSIQAFNVACVEYHSPEFRAYLIGDKFKSCHYAYTIERVNSGRDIYHELTIITTSLSELDGEEPGIVEHFAYNSKEDAERDIENANQFSNIEFDEA
jgi:hypothetical protein